MKKVEERSSPGCVMCEFVMHRLREWLQDGHTQDELETGLEEICSVMPESVKVRSYLQNHQYHKKE